MSETSPQFWNRETQAMETETVYGEGAMNLVYETNIGRSISKNLLSRHWISKAYGALQSSSLSSAKVPGFVQKFGIDMSEFEEKNWQSFNDFFIRQFKPGKREFVADCKRMPAPCEGRYLGFERLARHQELPVKGVWLPVSPLLEKEEWTDVFAGGPGYIARLCPVDYHRFHFPDEGKVIAQYRATGPLESVNPKALKTNPQILFTNERSIQILETKNFGKLAYIAVGAICVGRIEYSHQSLEFKRGEENGYFLFGGSTVVVLGEPGKWRIDSDILEKSAEGVESYIKLGSAMATQRTPNFD